MLQEQISETFLIHGDAPLTLTGEKQIAFKLTTKASDFNALKTDLVYSSPLKRAVRSTAAAFPAKRIKLDPRLRELDASGGLVKEELQSYVETTCPGANFDFGRVPDKPWCSPECVGIAKKDRIQRILKEIQQQTLKGKRVIIVAHGGVFRNMVGQVKPFPKAWGAFRGWPKNFKPYYARFVSEASPLQLCVANQDESTVILVRHAHSKAQAARTLARQVAKFEANPKPEKAKSLKARIQRFNKH